MKKLFLSLTLAAASFAAFAQVPTIGIRGGVNFASLLIGAQGTDVTITTGTLTTYSVGVFADFKFGGVSLQPALNYVGRGGNFNEDGVMAKFDLRYLQVPVNLVYHVPVLIGNVYFGAGPYVAYGTSGTVTANDGSGSGTQSANAKFGGADGEFTSTDVGADVIIGLQFKTGFLVHFNYDLGLANIVNNDNPNNTGGGSFKTRTWGLSVGYAF
jgi:hypothetical protein